MPDTETVEQEIQVPVFLSGIVAKIEGVDICMDGATHRLQTLLGPARLKPSNDEVRAILDRVSGKRLRVTVAGYPVWGPECGYLRTYYAAPSEEASERLGARP
jgi:hypothetical protein